MCAALWGGAGLTAMSGKATPLLIGLLAWQGTVYAPAPLMSVLATRTQLSPELERRRRSEYRRERFQAMAPYIGGAAAALIGLAVFAAFVGVGGSHPGTHAKNPF